MGTNFYLHYEHNHEPSDCPVCRKHDNYELHIGKCSMGWVFLWRGWFSDDLDGPGVDLRTSTDWLNYIEQQVVHGAKIKDEYYSDWSFIKFRDRVLVKRDKHNRREGTTPEGDDILYDYFS